MPLRRITLSGRLSAKESHEVWKTVARGIICMVLDIAITLAISISLFYMFAGYMVSPYERPLPCNDDSIKMPFKENTVRMKHLLAVALGTPFFIICFVEALVYFHSQGPNKLANYFVTSTLLYLKYELTFALCVFLMEYLKCTFGRLRPHFIAACQPDWSRMDCTEKESIPASQTYCMNDVRRVRTARTSFRRGSFSVDLQTALHWAARRGYEEICVLLLAHGFSREVKDKKGRTPFDVCAEDSVELREILRPESIECDEIMPSAVEKRRHSEETDGDEKFVPNYIQHPPFPYVSKASSFDCGTKAPSSPTVTNGYFSYGRRDSINKTRFLLVRTCFTDGKQAFKRVTLPGGSTVEQLKKMVERSMRNGKVEAILTLPDRVLVEDDAQIAQFSDCQRVEVIYADEDPSPEVGEKIIDIRPNGSMEKEGEQQEVHITESEAAGGDSFPITLMESFSNDQPDSSTAAQEENLSNEGSIPIEKIPSMDVTPVETEDNNHSEVESAQKISLRKSIDSDPGDFVKIETPDNGNSAAEVKSATPPTPPIMVSSTSKEEEKKEAGGLEAVEKVEVKPEPQPGVGVVKLEKKPKDRSLGTGLLTWMDENPNIVRCCATTAAVVGLAGIASFVYARRIRSGGF